MCEIKMKTTLAAALVALGLAAADAERSYTDDLGIVHTTDIDKPTIVTFAHTAVSLFDYGKTYQRNMDTTLPENESLSSLELLFSVQV